MNSTSSVSLRQELEDQRRQEKRNSGDTSSNFYKGTFAVADTAEQEQFMMDETEHSSVYVTPESQPGLDGNLTEQSDQSFSDSESSSLSIEHVEGKLDKQEVFV